MTMRNKTFGMVALIVIAALLAFGMIGSAFAAPAPVADPKVVVCKYVGGTDEVLQTGQNPIEVAASSLTNPSVGWDGSTFPFYWTDEQGLSVAIGFEGQGLDITDCPGYEPPPSDTPVPTATDTATATATLEPDVTPSDTPTATATSEQPQPTSTPEPPEHPPTGPGDFLPLAVPITAVLGSLGAFALALRKRN